MRRERLAPDAFGLPVDALRAGAYTDAYFNHAKGLLEAMDRHPRVVMQVFQREHAVLAGVDEAIAVLRLAAGHFDRDGAWVPAWHELDVHALHEGDEVEPWETVMTIEGDYGRFAHLETIYLGSLARGTLIARNVREAVQAARGKPLLFFPARHDHHRTQQIDGWAAHVGGAAGVSTDAQGAWWGGQGLGTVPHALIAAFGGDTVAAAVAFADAFDEQMNLTVLVDFENDSARTAVAVADALGRRLWGVRLDTSDRLADLGLQRVYGGDAPTGVAPALVHQVREELDARGHGHVRIVVSGGFTAERIRQFEADEVPVDVYGVGSSLLRGRNDFTADIVVVEGHPGGKVGRSQRPNPRLERVD